MKKILFVFAFLFVACNDNEDPKKETEFDRTAFLNNYSSNFIVPGFASLNLAVGSLNDAIQATSSAESLKLQGDRWWSAYNAFLKVSSFNIGPAAEEVITKSFLEEVGTFPISRARIEAKLASGTFEMNDFQRDSRGFLALEFLIFDSNIQSTENALNYAKAISAQLASKTEEVSNGWNSYQADFVSNNGTAAGSSTSQLYNEFVKSFEALKNFKIGIPLGVRPGQTSALPQNVEAYYSGYSADFARSHFEMIKNVWVGSNQLGFKDYLLTVEGGKTLVANTETQLKAVELAFDNVSNTDFQTQNIDQNLALIDLHTELQKLTRFFKSEMSSILGIAITFSSGDGD